MPSTALGSNTRGEQAMARQAMARPPTVVEIEPTPSKASPNFVMRVVARVPAMPAMPAMPARMTTGLLPYLVMLAFVTTLPALYFFVDADYGHNAVRGGVIGATALAAALPALTACPDCFNLGLFVHTAVEAKVLHATITYATAAGTPAVDVGFAWTGAAVVIAHLLPFYLVDHAMLLRVLAAVGVPVNVALAVFQDADQLLPSVALSAFGLLLLTVCAGPCPLLAKLRAELGC